VPENPFSLEVGDGALPGHTSGKGVPALLLHGGPGLPDYLEGLAAELGDIFTTIRYTQRGTPPATAGGPYTVESHMADAIAVLDAFGLEQAWAIGHSWGGHLALHLAVAHPERLYGVICINPLGATDDVIPEFRANLRRGLSDEQLARLDELDAIDDAEATEEEALEFLGIIWPNYFFDPSTAPPLPFKNFGIECSNETWASMKEHFEAGTLTKGLRKVKLPVLFVHAINDPLPISTSIETRKLVRGSKIARISRCGHLPWIEQPGFTPRAIRGLFAQM
jgi:pimeloyl-ACP methyl ester carboxylesterase